MDNRKKILLCLTGVISSVLLAIILIHNLSPNRQTVYKPHPPIDNPLEIYNKSVDNARAAKNLKYKITQLSTSSVQDHHYPETSTKTITLNNIDTENFTAAVEESYTANNLHTISSEIYSNTTAYLTVEGVPFQCQINSEEYLSRFYPSVLFSPENYKSISGVRAEDHYIISFYDSTGFESWFNDHNGKFLYSRGNAYITKDGILHKSIYNISYKINNITFRNMITIELEYENIEVISTPNDPDIYTPISYIDGPGLLEIICGKLLSAKKLTTEYTSKLICQAFGDERTEQIHTTISSQDLLLDSKTVISNSSQIDNVVQHEKIERFENGIYSVSEDGAELENHNYYDSEILRATCQDTAVGTIMLPQYIADVQLISKETSMYLLITANEDFISRVIDDTCVTLYGSSTLLSEMAEKYETKEILCFLEIDPDTYLPVASGIHFEGEYTISGIPYSLLAKFDQSYIMSSK